MGQIVRRLNTSHDMIFGLGPAGFLTDKSAVVQKVQTRLLLFSGEWFLDIGAGVPYVTNFARKPENSLLIESVLKQRILDTAGVTELIDFDMNFDHISRLGTVSGTVDTLYDSLGDFEVRL